jgi:hypothetical protein
MALTDTPTPRSQPQILGEMLDGVTSRIGIRRLKVGNPILSILEAVSLSTATSTADAFRTLKSKDIDNTTGIALQRIGNDEKIPQLGPIAATTSVTISDTSFVKTSSNIYHGSPAPIVGSETINVDKTTTFNDAPSTGTIYIGRGTPRSEGPINYSAKTDNTNHWTLTLSTPIASFHNQGEEVVLGQGGDRTINNGQTVSTPAGALSNPVQYSVIVGGVIPDGEVELKDVIVRCTVSGTQGNVPENTITSFNGAAPFGGASVTNPNRVTSGRDTETTQEYRDRIKKIRNTKAKGTDLAIKTAVINLTAPDEQKTVLSSSLVRRHQKPSILFIDDGNGYEPISSGIGFEVLRDSASGGEIDFKTIYSPICIASVESLNEGPYLIKTGDTLEVEIGGTVQTHIFDTTVFNSSVVATPYDVVDSINANSLVSFKARVSSNSSKVSIFPKDDTIDNVRVVGGTANEALGFPTQKAYTVLLYKNDRLLNTNEYNLDRATGSLALTGELAAEDKLTLGSLWSRGFVESAEIDTFNLAADQALWFVVDGGTEVIDSSRHGVSTLTISVAKSLPSSYHLSIKNSNNFSSYVAAGQSILLYRTENNNLPAALEGTWKIINVPAADTVIIEYPCMNAARKLPATANIANNKILICGGLSSNGSGILKTAEIYDPSTGSWMSAASMAYPRYGHTATTLADGRVLVVGGMGPNGIALDTVEYYTPATDTWTNTNPMTSGKYLHAAILLSNNNVLVAGGLSDLTPWTPTGDSAEFNPSTNHWTNGTTFAVPRYACSLVNLVGGNVFMVGGLTTAPSPYIEDTDSTANTAKFSATLTTNIYNASGHMWSAAASVPEATTRTAYRNYVAQRVDTNKVVAVADNQYYLYNVSGNTWTSSGAIAQSPDFAAGEAIYNGTSSLNETAGGTAFSSLGRSNPLISTANGTIVMPFAEYLNTTGTAYKGHFHLAYSLVDDKWHKVGTVGNVTLSGGKSFWGSTYSPLDADGVIVFGGQQGFDGRSTLVQSFLQESAVSSTVETIITDTNTVSYPSPVTGAFGGVQGWVIYNTSKPVLKTNISTGSYSAATLAENININIILMGRLQLRIKIHLFVLKQIII